MLLPEIDPINGIQVQVSAWSSQNHTYSKILVILLGFHSFTVISDIRFVWQIS